MGIACDGDDGGQSDAWIREALESEILCFGCGYMPLYVSNMHAHACHSAWLLRLC